jgi:purine-cytosine permease-like protein
LSWLVTTFGIKIFHHYERFVLSPILRLIIANEVPRYAWLPQVAALLILFRSAGPSFDFNSQSTGDTATIAGHRLSFLSVCLSSAITYAPCSSDYLVYSSPSYTTRWKVFWAVMLGLTLSFTLTFTLGIGLASGLPNNSLWVAAGSGSGALIVAGFSPLGAIGSICSITTALGLISNMVPEIYSSGINFQILGRHAVAIPRFIWNALGLIVVVVAALAGRNNLSQIFTNFLALMGYWVVMWIVISVEDEFIFKRRRRPKYEWSDWDKQEKLPHGIAASVAFMLGWLAAVMCMAQAWYVGPVARLIGSDGGDLGNYVSFVVVGLLYPPLRLCEVRKMGR